MLDCACYPFWDISISAAVLLSKKRTSPPSWIKRTDLMNLSPTLPFELYFTRFVILFFTETSLDFTLFLFGKSHQYGRFARISFKNDDI